MRLWPDPTDPMGFKVHLFNGGDWQSAKDYVAREIGVSRWWPGARKFTPAVSVDNRNLDRFRNFELARSIYREAVPAPGTLVERYLARRGLGAVNTLRFHPACPFGQERLPAMVAPMVGIHDNAFRGIHRTPLTHDGGKSDMGKKMLGSSAGAVVKLSQDEDVTTVLGIGEGIETTLSLPMLSECFGIPVWACLNAEGVRKFPVLPGIEVLWIAVDNDPSGAGERAAQRCADRWTAAGCEVWLQTPNAVRSDLNDIVKEYRGAR
jgi:hypothetical protein